jgi:hypothetical protein
MKQDELYKAKDPDLAASLKAMKRAAALARKIAIQTNTSIVVVRNGQVAHITADELRAQGEG